MSTAPRPQISSSTISPPNGSRCQPSGFTGTTSVWPISSSVGAFGSLPSMRATRFSRPGCARRSARGRDRCRRGTARARRCCGSRKPDSGVPSLTHALRIRCASRSLDSFAIVVASSAVTTGLESRSFGDPVVEHAALFPAFGHADVHHVLEVGEGLALGHRSPVPLREHLVRELGNRRRTESRDRRRAAAPCARRGAPGSRAPGPATSVKG